MEAGASPRIFGNKGGADRRVNVLEPSSQLHSCPPVSSRSIFAVADAHRLVEFFAFLLIFAFISFPDKQPAMTPFTRRITHQTYPAARDKFHNVFRVPTQCENAACPPESCRRRFFPPFLHEGAVLSTWRAPNHSRVENPFYNSSANISEIRLLAALDDAKKNGDLFLQFSFFDLLSVFNLHLFAPQQRPVDGFFISLWDNIG